MDRTPCQKTQVYTAHRWKALRDKSLKEIISLKILIPKGKNSETKSERDPYDLDPGSITTTTSTTNLLNRFETALAISI